MDLPTAIGVPPQIRTRRPNTSTVRSVEPRFRQCPVTGTGPQRLVVPSPTLHAKVADQEDSMGVPRRQSNVSPHQYRTAFTPIQNDEWASRRQPLTKHVIGCAHSCRTLKAANPLPIQCSVSVLFSRWRRLARPQGATFDMTIVSSLPCDGADDITGL